MDRFVEFGSDSYLVMTLILVLGRGSDLFSTWLATPNLALEANPIAKGLGWRWGIPLNLVLCLGFGCWPLPAIILTTTSLLIASRNFQLAWLMRSMGESRYRAWMVQRMSETSPALFVGCLLAQTLIYGIVGAPLVWSGYRFQMLIPFAIGVGIVTFAIVVSFFTLLAMIRMRKQDKIMEHEVFQANRQA